MSPSRIVPDVLESYPDAKLALRLWDVYLKCVDPVLKILHIPSVQSTVISTILEPRSARAPEVALTFAIYFAAVTALGHDKDRDPIDRYWENARLLQRFKMALDQLLVVTDIMDQPDMMSLQALAIYAVSNTATRHTQWRSEDSIEH